MKIFRENRGTHSIRAHSRSKLLLCVHLNRSAVLLVVPALVGCGLGKSIPSATSTTTITGTSNPAGSITVTSTATVTEISTMSSTATQTILNTATNTNTSANSSTLTATNSAVNTVSATASSTATSTSVAASGVEVPGPSAQLFANPNYGLGIGLLYTCTRNFYVDGVKGNDSNPGTSASPWKTIQQADSASRTGGDCINVVPGTYSTSVTLTHGGTSASTNGYIVYRCQTLDGCHVLFNGYAGSPVWQFIGSNYVVVDGFEIDGNGNDTVYGNSYGGLADTCFRSVQMSQY